MMKKTMKHTAAVAACFIAACSAFISCQTPKKDAVSADSYGTQIAVPDAQAGTPSDGSASSDPYSMKRIKGSKSFTEQLLGTGRYISVDKSSLFTVSMFGGRTQKTIELVVKPQTDMGGFLVRYDTSLYCIYMAHDDRTAFINAVNQYLSDFENKQLIRKTLKTAAIYGTASSFQEFGTLKIMMSYYSRPSLAFGYKFVGNSPYFFMKVSKADNLSDAVVGDNRVKESIEQNYYFTKAQAKQLADFLADENIQKALSGTGEPAKQTNDTY